MGIAEILASVDHEIAQLKQARALLSSGSTAAKRAPGRPKITAAKAGKPAKAKKRTLSPEGRKRIAEAQKLRWAAHKKAAPAAQK